MQQQNQINQLKISNGMEKYFNISTRDYFASKTDVSQYEFKTIEAGCEFVGMAKPENDDTVAFVKLAMAIEAKLKYMAADAMLAEREKSIT